MSRFIDEYAFNALSLPVRERLAHMLREGGDERLVAFVPGARVSVGFVFFLAGAGVLGALACFGHIADAGSSVDPASQGALFAGATLLALIGLTALCWLVARAFFRPPEWLATGHLVSGAHIVHVGDSTVSIVPADRLGRATITDYYRRGSHQFTTVEYHLNGEVLQDARFSIVFDTPGKARDFVPRLEAARARYQEARARKSMKAMLRIDPFADCVGAAGWRAKDGESLEGPRVRAMPVAVRVIRWVLPVVIVGAGAHAFFDSLAARCRRDPACRREDGVRSVPYREPVGSPSLLGRDR